MQIFLTSRTESSHSKVRPYSHGFTLVELLISVAIIGMVSSLVLTKYGSFDSTVLLKGLAYEIALALRESQVRSVSVARNDDSFDHPFGMTFSLLNNKQYTSFRYKDDTAHPEYVDSNADGVPDLPAEDIRTFTIARTMIIKDLCVTEAGESENCNIDRLDVSFRRPKFRGLFSVDNPAVQNEDIVSARIIVGTSTGDNEFAVLVTSLGQISVQKN